MPSPFPLAPDEFPWELSHPSVSRVHTLSPPSCPPQGDMGFLPAVLLLPIQLSSLFHNPVPSLALCSSPSSHLLPALLCRVNHKVMIPRSGNGCSAGPDPGASTFPLRISLTLPMRHPLEKGDIESCVACISSRIWHHEGPNTAIVSQVFNTYFTVT